jgi:hypothetical protein
VRTFWLVAKLERHFLCFRAGFLVEHKKNNPTGTAERGVFFLKLSNFKTGMPYKKIEWDVSIFFSLDHLVLHIHFQSNTNICNTLAKTTTMWFWLETAINDQYLILHTCILQWTGVVCVCVSPWNWTAYARTVHKAHIQQRIAFELYLFFPFFLNLQFSKISHQHSSLCPVVERS